MRAINKLNFQIRLQDLIFCGIMRIVKIDLSKYSDMNICVAVSGGRDSMALLHYMLEHGKEFNITLSAVNFDHKMRGESSARDSAFVASYCKEKGVPLLFFSWDEDTPKSETGARRWRFSKYCEVINPKTLPDGTLWKGADAVATAHHLNDNAETVLFNLARGSGMAGLAGIGDVNFEGAGNKRWKLIRPLAGVPREGIDAYVLQNSVPYVDDETNFTDNYTRNKIRHKVLPELERAVPGATGAIYRFSRIAAEDEEYFENLIKERGLVRKTPLGYEIPHCPERALFKRAVLQCLSLSEVRDYTFEHLERLYELQFAERGKKFEFRGYTAFNDGDKIALCNDGILKYSESIYPFWEFFGCEKEFSGQSLYIGEAEDFNGGEYNLSCVKTLKFDLDKIPPQAVIRFMREGDRFKKFGGGAKNLGSYFTDKKIPVRMRKNIPLIAAGSEILVVCGVEISENVKVDAETENIALCAASDYEKLTKI